MKLSDLDGKGSFQPKIDDTLANRTVPTSAAKYSRNDPRSLRIDKSLIEMHIRDLAPFTTCKKPGFKRFVQTLNPNYNLGKRHYYQKMTMKACDNAVETIKLKIQKDNPSTATLLIDGWSVYRHGHLGLLLVYLNRHFERVTLCLACTPFDEAETGDNLSNYVEEKLEEWSLKEKVDLIISNSAANMLKMGKMLQMDHLGCIFHSLQCVIKKEMFSDLAIKRILDIARRIGNYSAMSIQLNNFLRDIQVKLGQELLSLINDCKTRWDSTFLMAKRILKLEPVIKELLKNHDWQSKLEGKNKKKRVFEDQEMNKELDMSLSASDWTLLSTVVSLLKPFHEATLEFSKATANISKVVPMITTLLESVQEKRYELKPVKDLKKKIRRELTDRLGKVESIDRYAIATLCDPTIKANLFRDQELLDLAKKELERLVLREAEQNNNNGDTNYLKFCVATLVTGFGSLFGPSMFMPVPQMCLLSLFITFGEPHSRLLIDWATNSGERRDVVLRLVRGPGNHLAEMGPRPKQIMGVLGVISGRQSRPW